MPAAALEGQGQGCPAGRACSSAAAADAQEHSAGCLLAQGVLKVAQEAAGVQAFVTTRCDCKQRFFVLKVYVAF